MISDDCLSLVGKVNKTHGVDGEMSVSFFDTDVAECVDVDTCLFFKIDGIPVPFFVESVRPRGNESLLITLEGEDTQAHAANFVGKDVYMHVDDVPEYEAPEGEGLYADQLIGLMAYTDDGDEIGEIVDFDDSTDNPLFIIRRSDDSLVYVPIVDEFITDIDLDARRISFELPDGLLEQ